MSEIGYSRKKSKVCVVTGTRAEYGLLYWVMKEIGRSSALSLQLAVTGMHLSPEFGSTYRTIEEDGFRIDARVEMLLSSDTAVGVAKSVSLGVSGFADAFERLSPDAVLVLGDRYEIMSAVQTAYMMGIPVAHIAGGETTEGAIDEGMRHAITKMSSIHFALAEPYRRRIIQMGEDPKAVFCVGSPGLDYLKKLSFLSREELRCALDFPFSSPAFLVTYHPATLGESADAFSGLLEALDSFPDASVVFTYPNSDADGRRIMSMIDDYVAKNPSRSRAYASLGQKKYLSALAHMNLALGNSSSGLTEAPSFKIPTVNVGDRQRGRLRAQSVIDCEPYADNIREAILTALSPAFQAKLPDTVNPYGEGNASRSIVDILSRWENRSCRKKFYDLEFSV